jgi:hypothetical protein
MPRSALIALAALALAAPAAAQSKQFDKTVALEPGGYLSLHATKGSVKLSSWDRNQVEIHALIQAPAFVSSDYARRSVEATTVDVSGGGRDVRIRSNYDDVPYEHAWLMGRSRTVPEIHYEIRAPRKLELRLDVDRSNTGLRGFDGRIDIVSDRSELDVSDLAGKITIEVDRGGDSRLERIDGSLRVEADRTDLTIAFAHVDDRSSIEADRGEVRITVPAKQGLTIDADLTRRADFDSDLSMRRRHEDRRRFTADVNGGGPTLAIGMDRGRVSLRSS